jgi:hypothetical protein
MKTVLLTMLLTTGALFLHHNATAQTPNFAPLLGKWEGKLGEGVLTEVWQQRNETHLTGKGYYVVGEDTIINELLVIQQIGSHWVFIASINGAPPVLFGLKENEKHKWVFENSEHDFPQQVVYSIQKDGSLLAWIEGLQDGKMVKEDYLLQRTSSANR